MISAFKMDIDKIVLDGAALADVGTSGNFTNLDARFWAAAGATAAHDLDDRVVYNTLTGDIYYDSDGTGAIAAQRIATHAEFDAFALEAVDFAVINGTGASGAHLIGTAGNDTLTGGAGNDTLEGLGGHDFLIGNGGNDVLSGGDGIDDLSGGDGNDRLDAGLNGDLMSGGAGADTFVFTTPASEANLEMIRDFASGIDRLELDNESIWFLGPSGSFSAGDARFYSAPGATTAHDASDRIIFNSSNGRLFHDADGTESTWAPVHFATLQVGATLLATDISIINGSGTGGGGGGGSTINGTSGNDTLSGTSGNDTINGLGGNDTLNGHEGEDVLRGGDGNDYLIDTDFDHFDTLDGGLGDDTYELHNPDLDPSLLADAGGIDTVISTGSYVLPDGIENLTMRGNFDAFGTGNALDNRIVMESMIFIRQTVDGADGDDTLVGGNWQDTFAFGAGSGDTGNDVVDGGEERDDMNFSGARSGIVADMRTGTLTGGGTGGAGTVAFTRIETIVGTSFNDQLTAHDGVFVENNDDGGGDFHGASLSGEAGNDTLIGGAHQDQLSGGEGDDRISGGADNDFLSGRAGSDSFIFNVAAGDASFDTVQDYAAGLDKIRLDGTAMSQLGASGNFTAGDERFHAGTAAHDTSDRVIWDGRTLWYDPDGTGSQAMLRIAEFFGTPAMTATDIAVDNGSGPSGQVINGTSGNDTTPVDPATTP